MKSTTVFQFKHFALSNQRSAMKVSTDGVLLGAWSSIPAEGVICDVGCGTGLLALMLAQRSKARVIGVEIDKSAFDEMQYNFIQSPWSDRVRAVHGDICVLADSLPMVDMIISNPPYFTDSLRADDGARDLARHEESLSYEALVEIASCKLNESGFLSLIAPYDRRDEIVAYGVDSRLHLVRECRVAYRKGKHSKRVMMELGKVDTGYDLTEMAVQNEGGGYTDEYRALTKDFYLDF